MEPVILEIRAAVGGDDAKLLVHDQFNVYRRFAARLGIRLELLESRPG